MLIRRAYFDLIGLPPRAEQVNRFIDDPSPFAYENLIDELLQSAHYGERWGRYWLDVARFAESAGFEADDDRDAAYQYRDFVIRALNGDMPYDEFVRLQLAGDFFRPVDPEAHRATGFLVAGVENLVQTIRELERDRYDRLDDMVSTVGTAFLGLTIGCARCHDHKYDPLSQIDYYRFLVSFQRTDSVEKELVEGNRKTKAFVAFDVKDRIWPKFKKKRDLISFHKSIFWFAAT